MIFGCKFHCVFCGILRGLKYRTRIYWVDIFHQFQQTRWDAVKTFKLPMSCASTWAPACVRVWCLCTCSSGGYRCIIQVRQSQHFTQELIFNFLLISILFFLQLAIDVWHSCHFEMSGPSLLELGGLAQKPNLSRNSWVEDRYASCNLEDYWCATDLRRHAGCRCPGAKLLCPMSHFTQHAPSLNKQCYRDVGNL